MNVIYLIYGYLLLYQVWDAQSSGEFRKWGQRYYNMFHAFLFVYDVPTPVLSFSLNGVFLFQQFYDLLGECSADTPEN